MNKPHCMLVPLTKVDFVSYEIDDWLLWQTSHPALVWLKINPNLHRPVIGGNLIIDSMDIRI